MSKAATPRNRLRELALAQRAEEPELVAEPTPPPPLQSENRDQISETHASEVRSVPAVSEHGSRGDFRKATVTLPPAMFTELHQAAHDRKMAGEPGAQISALLREAWAFWTAAGMPRQK